MNRRVRKHERLVAAGVPGPDASTATTTAAAALSGAVAGAAVGAFAGPVAAVIGGAIGAASGAAAGAVAAEKAELDAVHDERLDAEIGVVESSMGAAPRNQPRPRRGTFSAASAGGHTTPGREAPDAGPIPSTREG